MPTQRFQWLTDAIARHLATWASRGHRKKGEPSPFEPLNEASIVTILDRIFTGLGFCTWPESRKYGGKDQALDLWANAIDGSDAHMIEAKVVWDYADIRLNRKRFDEQRELIGDFARLTATKVQAVKLVVWVMFAKVQEIVTAGENVKGMRLGDALAAIKKEFPNASLEGASRLSLEEHCDCQDCKFAHVFCWVIK